MWNGVEYDRVADPQAAWGESVIERLDVAADGLVVDAGCGSGRVTETLLSKYPGLRVVALDASSSMLMVARERLSKYGDRVHFAQASLAEDFGAQCSAWVPFDAVVSTGTFHWVPDHRTLFRRIFGILRPGGQFVAQFGGHGSVLAVRDQLDQLGVEWRSYNNYATHPDTERALVDAGFDSVRCWANDEVVEFPDQSSLVAYLESGVIRPYVSHLSREEQTAVAQRVAEGLGELAVRFSRMNLVARSPQ